MSRYREVSGGTEYLFSYRVPLVIDNSAGSVVATDVAITIPTDYDDFWKQINSNAGEDIRVLGPDGVTLQSFKLTGYTFVSRTLTINVDNAVMLASSIPGAVLWLAWGNATVGAPTYASFTPSSPYTAYLIESRLTPDVMLDWRREPVGATKPSQRIQKTPSAQIIVAINYRKALGLRSAPYAGGYEDEEPQGFDYAVYNSSAAAQSAMVDKTQIRADNDNVYVLVKAGSDGSTYTLSVLMYTTSKNTGNPARTLEMRAIVEVSDLIP